MADLALIENHVDQLLADYFMRLAQGQDISPAERFRLEGYLQAIISFELMSEASLIKLKRQHIGNKCLANADNACWLLPFEMRAAPVKPSTPSD